jgi:hypothetical protein
MEKLERLTIESHMPQGDANTPPLAPLWGRVFGETGRNPPSQLDFRRSGPDRSQDTTPVVPWTSGGRSKNSTPERGPGGVLRSRTASGCKPTVKRSSNQERPTLWISDITQA